MTTPPGSGRTTEKSTTCQFHSSKKKTSKKNLVKMRGTDLLLSNRGAFCGYYEDGGNGYVVVSAGFSTQVGN